MKLSEFKAQLETLETLSFSEPFNKMVAPHFHITEVGLVTKHFIDCGGQVRLEKAINFQLFVATDINHRLAPQKLLSIINMSEKLFEGEDLPVEVEYQQGTIGRFGLDFHDGFFYLVPKHTECLAEDSCGILQKPTIQVKNHKEKGTIGTPSKDGSSCC